MRIRLLGVVSALCVVLAGSSDDASAARSSFTETRYPIVLAHGLAGFDSIFGVLDYFFGIPPALGDGGAQVFVTQVSAFNSSFVRGEQLLEQVEFIAASTGAGKVNLIGHSQGGIDARYVMSVRPDLVASVTTVGTPNTGTPVADALLDFLLSGQVDPQMVADLVNRLGELIALLSNNDDPQDAAGAILGLTTAGAAGFNGLFPGGMPASPCGEGADAVGDIRVFSWGGTGVITNIFDLSDILLGLTATLFDEDTDGLVGRCSSHFGQVLRDDYQMNHLDEVNQLLGLTGLFATDPKSVFRTHANRLKNAGL